MQKRIFVLFEIVTYVQAWSSLFQLSTLADHQEQLTKVNKTFFEQLKQPDCWVQANIQKGLRGLKPPEVYTKISGSIFLRKR